MTTSLAAAEEIFTELGWADAAPSALLTLPLGSPTQRRTALAGLATGDWSRVVETSGGWQWLPTTTVDPSRLGVFAIRLGVDARRAVTVMPAPEVIDDDLAAALLAERGPRFAQAFVDVVASRQNWRFGAGPVAVRLVHRFGLPTPTSDGYLWAWAALATAVLARDSAALPVDGSPQRAETATPDRWRCAVDVITDRFTDHLDAAVGLPTDPRVLALIRLGVDHGLLTIDHAIALALGALDRAPRPIDRKAWVRVLRTDLGWSDASVVAAAESLVPVLAHGDAPVVEALAPALIAGVSDDLIADIATVCLTVRTKKTLRVVLDALAARHVPPDVAEGVAAQVEPLLNDRVLGGPVRRLLDAWAVTATAAPELTDAQWRPTPEVWTVPQFDRGDKEPRPETVTALAGELTRRGDSGVDDVIVERFLAVTHALARTDPDAARRALAGLSRTQFPAETAWRDGRPVAAPDRFCPDGCTDLAGVVRARHHQVFARFEDLPCLLSEPSRDDLTITPADLTARLAIYADAGVPASEADLLLAMVRLGGDIDAPISARLMGLQVPVVGFDGTPLDVTAGPAVLAALADPPSDPGLIAQKTWWATGPFTPPESFAAFPPRLAPYRFPVIPHWGDAALMVWPDPFDRAVGIRWRQTARRSAPLPPGAAVNLLVASATAHPTATADVGVAITEAWRRGLLRPGVADVRYLGWMTTPANLGTVAATLVERAAEGMTSVVWPVLDDLLAASAARPRLLAGTVAVVETMVRLLPVVRDAVAQGVAESGVLDVPGLRALAAAAGSSAAVKTARAAIADLPAQTTPVVREVTPVLDFDAVWPVDAGRATAVADDAHVAVQWDDPQGHPRMVRVTLTLPDHPGVEFRMVKRWWYDLIHEGQCRAARYPAHEPTNGTAADGALVVGAADAWLHWDESTERLTVEAVRHPQADADPSARRPIAPLTTSLVAALLASVGHDGLPGQETGHYLVELVDSGTLGSESVAAAMRVLLVCETYDPSRLAALVDRTPHTLPVLWPVLTESIRAAAAAPIAPRWTNRVLDATLTFCTHLREAAHRGHIDLDRQDLVQLAGRRGAAATKAGRLLEQCLF